MPNITIQTPIIIATRPHVGIPISWAIFVAISTACSLTFSVSLFVGVGGVVLIFSPKRSSNVVVIKENN